MVKENYRKCGTILEKHLNLSKATDAQYSVGSPSYWRGYLKRNSSYVFGGSSPEGVVASGFSSQYLASTDFAWDQDTEDTSSGPIIFGGAGTHNYELSGGTNYDGGSIIGSDGALAPDLSKITAGYNLFTNKEKYDVDFLIMGSANYSKEKGSIFSKSFNWCCRTKKRFSSVYLSIQRSILKRIW